MSTFVYYRGMLSLVEVKINHIMYFDNLVRFNKY
jgi:hypothetical protein